MIKETPTRKKKRTKKKKKKMGDGEEGESTSGSTNLSSKHLFELISDPLVEFSEAEEEGLAGMTEDEEGGSGEEGGEDEVLNVLDELEERKAFVSLDRTTDF